MKKIPILYHCFLNQSGYGQSATNYILSLHNSGKYDIKIHTFSKKPLPPIFSQNKCKLFKEMIDKKDDKDRINVFQIIPPMQRRVKRVGRSIGFFVFETFSPPVEWLSYLNKNSAIVTPSQFNYRILAHEQIKKPLYYFPHCFDTKIYNKNVEKLNNYEKFTFLFIGTWKIRKGYVPLIEAFLKEFDEHDNVQLIIKTDKLKEALEYVEKMKKQYKINKGKNTIIFEDKKYSEEDISRFIKSVDVVVSPTFGEGFLLPGLQAMALDVPIIVTDFSGPLDYASEETCTFFNKSGFTLHSSMDGVPQFRRKKWAFVSTKEIRKKMRYAMDNYKILQEKSRNGYKFVHENFNYEKTENIFSEILRNL